MFSDHKIWLQNVTHPYIEEHDPQRDVYVEPAEQFNLLRDTYLELLNPLYWILEYGNSWSHKYTSFL